MMTIRAGDVRAELGLGEEYRDWIEALEEVEGPFPPLELPEGDKLGALLERLNVPSEDHPAIAEAALLVAQAGSSWRWLLDRTVKAARDLMGGDAPVPVGPVMPEHGLAGRWFYVVSCLATTSAVRALHSEIDVPDDVSWRSLGILGEKIAVRRRAADEQAPFLDHDYVMHVFRGRRYRLGQLDALAWNGYVDVRVPHTATPLTDAPDKAWGDEVHAFFRRMPRRYGRGIPFGYTAIPVNVNSWMVDLALREYLPDDHELRRFAGKLDFYTRSTDCQAPDDAGLTPGDRDAIEYAYGRTVVDLQTALSLPTENDVQRVILNHLQAGHHWAQAGAGWPIFEY
ncbi:acyltransferase domain-containing protein [Streptomyces sp. NPDC054841]